MFGLFFRFIITVVLCSIPCIKASASQEERWITPSFLFKIFPDCTIDPNKENSLDHSGVFTPSPEERALRADEEMPSEEELEPGTQNNLTFLPSHSHMEASLRYLFASNLDGFKGLHITTPDEYDKYHELHRQFFQTAIEPGTDNEEEALPSGVPLGKIIYKDPISDVHKRLQSILTKVKVTGVHVSIVFCKQAIRELYLEDGSCKSVHIIQCENLEKIQKDQFSISENCIIKSLSSIQKMCGFSGNTNSLNCIINVNNNAFFSVKKQKTTRKRSNQSNTRVTKSIRI